MPSGRYNEPKEHVKFLARMIRALGRRVAWADAEDLAELCRLHQVLDEAIAVAVDGLRSAGYTWQSLGAATGTTRQAAQAKWGNRTAGGFRMYCQTPDCGCHPPLNEVPSPGPAAARAATKESGHTVTSPAGAGELGTTKP